MSHTIDTRLLYIKWIMSGALNLYGWHNSQNTNSALLRTIKADMLC